MSDKAQTQPEENSASFESGFDPASLKNLILWKPGQSGNPKGKPKGTKNFKTILAQVLGAYKEDFAGEEIDGAKKVAITLFKKAVYEKNGDIAAIRELLDRLEGRPIQNINQRHDITDDKLSQAVDGIQQILNTNHDTGPASNP